MSKKNKSKKGNKVDLSTFLGSHAEPGVGHLPRAPREQHDEPEYNNRRGGRGGVFDRPMGHGGDREGQEDAPSAGDLADNWRRGPAAPSGGNSMMRRGGRDDDMGEGPPMSRGDEDGDWRSIMRKPAATENAGPVRLADEDSNWRRGPKAPEGDAAPVPPRSDQDDDWRRSAVDNRVDSAAPPAVPRGDQDDDWRRTAATTSVKEAAAPPSADLETDWRRAKAKADERPREGSSWRDRNAGSGPERPRLKLKARGAKAEDGEDSGSKPATEPASEGSAPAKREDKWKNVFRKEESAAPPRRFGDNSRDKERENAFSSFGTRNFRGNNGPTREERERMFSAFGGQKPREQEQPQQRSMESFAAFGGQRRERDFEREKADRERAFAAFGGQREREPRDGEEPKRRGEEGGKYLGGMERIQRERQALSKDSTSKPAVLPSMKRTTNWGGDSDEEEEAVKSLSPEELDTKTTSLVNAYFVMQDSREAIKSVRGLNTPAHMPELIKRIVDKGLESGVTKDLKLVAQLLSVLKKEKLISSDDLKKGLEIVTNAVQNEKYAKDSDVAPRVLELAPLLEQKLVLKDVELSADVKKVFFPSSEESTADSAAVGKALDTLLASGKRGTELAALAKEVKDVIMGHGALLLEKILADDEVVFDPSIKWADKKEFGAVLGYLLFEEYPSKDKVQEEVTALVVLQTRLNTKSFPKVKRGEREVSLVEETFIKLYQMDVLPEEAFQAWKEDETDTPGKLTVIVQTTQFFNFLDQSDESESEDEDE